MFEILVEVLFVFVMVLVYNEGKVIVKIVELLFVFDYLVDCYEIIVINDNFLDNSVEFLVVI